MTAKRSLVKWSAAAVFYGVATMSFAAQTLAPDRIADVLNTKHNFASTFTPKLPNNATRAVKSTDVNEVCVFCHTPHAATDGVRQLWNRGFAANPTDHYASSTLDSPAGNAELGIGSKMCLSCHDGTIALGSVNVLNGRATTSPYPPYGAINNSLSNTKIPDGAGTKSGYTSNIGNDLRNDHPIAFEYNAAFANQDGELYVPGTLKYAASAGAAPISGVHDSLATVPVHPAAPLEIVNTKNTVQCTTCHDPHIRGTGADEDVNIKFLRLNRFQKNAPQDGLFSVANDQLCLACHNKTGWANSAHAKNGMPPHTYTDAAADQREFPHNLNVWEAGCLNCHDTHTVAGAPKLLRAGANETTQISASSETCYQCHGAAGALNNALSDIKNLIPNAGVFNANPHSAVYNVGGGVDTYSDNHQLGLSTGSNGGNIVETQSNLQNNRHVDCSDCHHPHRMQATPHTHAAGVEHTNLVSPTGMLLGISGVEPDAPNNLPINGSVFAPYDTQAAYTVRQGAGDPTGNTNLVQTEYQICFKCHSNYGQSVGVTSDTPNIVAEFTRGVYPGDVDATVGKGSFHPVLVGTARNSAYTSNFVAPFNTGVGTQTMYCSDCHEPHTGTLKKAGDALCYDCHNTNNYGAGGGAAGNSGFGCVTTTPCGGVTAGTIPNLHRRHAEVVTNYRCNDCHVVRVHGWKTKAMLADTTNIGGEVNDTAGDKAIPYYKAPYYDNARLKLIGSVVKASNNWVKGDCGSSGCHL